MRHAHGLRGDPALSATLGGDLPFPARMQSQLAVSSPLGVGARDTCVLWLAAFASRRINRAATAFATAAMANDTRTLDAGSACATLGVTAPTTPKTKAVPSRATVGP